MDNAKQTVLADETLFQRACAEWVNRNIGHCVSNLMYHVGQNLEASAKIFDFDPDDAVTWFEVQDYEEPVRDFIMNDADYDELAEISEFAGHWDDVLESAGVSQEGWDSETDVDEEIKRLGKDEEVRTAVRDLFTESEEFIRAGLHFNLDPYYHEVFEHHVLNERWSGDDLIAQGETVFEFCDLLIWARTTTGQSISLDGVTTRIVRDLPDDHYVWSYVL